MSYSKRALSTGQIFNPDKYDKYKKELLEDHHHRIRFYEFPVSICKQLKAYKIIKEYMPKKYEKIIEYIEKYNPEEAEKVKKNKRLNLLSLFSRENLKKFIKSRTVKVKSLFKKSKTVTITKTKKSNPPGIFKHFMEEVVDNLKKPSEHIDFNAFAIKSHMLAEKFAKDYNLKVGSLKSCELVELHYYFINTVKPQTGALGMHEDDYAAVSYPTITLVWYLKKSPQIERGNFRAKNIVTQYDSDELGITVKTGKPDEDNNICSCLIFTGDITHAPEEMFGKGERSAIVFQFERIEGARGKIKKTRRKKKQTKK